MFSQALRRIHFLKYPLFFSGVLISLLFFLFPAADLWISSLAFDHGRFMQTESHLWIWLVYRGIPVLAWLVLLGGLLTLLLSWKKRPDWRKPLMFILCAQLLGPGILVHNVLKDNWGRARPFQTVQFGGEKQFSPAWVKADQCERNCSFVSGHAAMGFFPLVLAMLGQRYRGWLFVGLGLGAWTGAARIAQGGHYLSDIVFAFYVVYFAAWISYWLVFRQAPQSLWIKK